MNSSEFDRRFEDGESVIDALDLSAARRPRLDQRRVNVDFPLWMVEQLDLEASRRSDQPEVPPRLERTTFNDRPAYAITSRSRLGGLCCRGEGPPEGVRRLGVSWYPHS